MSRCMPITSDRIGRDRPWISNLTSRSESKLGDLMTLFNDHVMDFWFLCLIVSLRGSNAYDDVCFNFFI